MLVGFGLERKFGVFCGNYFGKWSLVGEYPLISKWELGFGDLWDYGDAQECVGLRLYLAEKRLRGFNAILRYANLAGNIPSIPLTPVPSPTHGELPKLI